MEKVTLIIECSLLPYSDEEEVKATIKEEIDTFVVPIFKVNTIVIRKG